MRAVLWREWRELIRDPYLLGIAAALPLVLLFLFSYALNLDLDHLRTAVLDRDRSPASREYVAAVAASGYFDIVASPRGDGELARLLDAGRARVGIVIPDGFGRDLAAGRDVTVQVLLDGSFPPPAMAAIGNLDMLEQSRTPRDLAARLARSGQPGLQPAVEVVPRVLYNPALSSRDFIVPGLLVVILMALPPLTAALAIVREKERGSIEQILVARLHPWDFIAGKLVPHAAIAFVQLLLILAAAALWFRTPIRGNIFLLLAVSVLYVACTVAIGLLVSTLTASPTAAMLAVVVVTVMPSMLFSGFIFPIFNMPFAIQLYTYLFPARFFTDVARGTMLKGAGLSALWPEILALAGYTAGITGLAALRMQRRLG